MNFLLLHGYLPPFFAAGGGPLGRRLRLWVLAGT